MAKRATIHDVARLSGFSTTAVSNALNDKDARISQETRHKIREAARELHYSPNALIRAIHSGRTRVLGVFMVVPTVGSRRLLSELLIHLQRAAAARCHDLLLHCTDCDEKTGEDASQFLDGRIDGLFYWGAREHEFVDHLVEREFPVVSLFSSIDRPGAGRVWPDETVGLRSALQHLINLGHTDVHVTPYPFGGPAVALRRQALEALRVELPIRIHQAEPFRAPQDRIKWLEGLFNSPKPPTAIIPGGTQDGYYAIAVAQKAGLRVPDDVSIICHEGFDLDFGYALSSVRAPIEEVSIQGVDLLLKMIEGKAPSPPEVTLSTAFVEGRSTGPSPVALPR